MENPPLQLVEPAVGVVVEVVVVTLEHSSRLVDGGDVVFTETEGFAINEALLCCGKHRVAARVVTEFDNARVNADGGDAGGIGVAEAGDGQRNGHDV